MRKCQGTSDEAEEEQAGEAEEEESETEPESNSSDDSNDESVAQSSQTHAILEKEKNILKNNLVDQRAIIFPPLYIMLGLNSQFNTNKRAIWLIE